MVTAAPVEGAPAVCQVWSEQLGALRAVLAGSEHVRSGGAAFTSWNSPNIPRKAAVVLFIDTIP